MNERARDRDGGSADQPGRALDSVFAAACPPAPGTLPLKRFVPRPRVRFERVRSGRSAGDAHPRSGRVIRSEGDRGEVGPAAFPPEEARGRDAHSVDTLDPTQHTAAQPRQPHPVAVGELSKGAGREHCREGEAAAVNGLEGPIDRPAPQPFGHRVGSSFPDAEPRRPRRVPGHPGGRCRGRERPSRVRGRRSPDARGRGLGPRVFSNGSHATIHSIAMLPAGSPEDAE